MRSIHIYMRDVSKYPKLTHKEMFELFIRLRRGDLRAKKPLIEGNLRFVVKIAFEFREKHPEIDVAEAVCAGNYGLIKAVEKFNPAVGKFTSYAVYWIKAYMFQLLEKRQFEDYDDDIYNEIDENIERNVIKRTIRDAVLKLDEEEKKLVSERYECGLSYRDIGGLYNLSRDAIALRDKKIKFKLKRILTNKL